MTILALIFGRGLAQAAGMIAGLVAVRLLAPSAFGAYSLATTTIGLIGILADMGLDPILTARTAANPQAQGVLLWAAIRWRFIATLATALVILLAALIPPLGRPDLLLVGVISLFPRGVIRAICAALTGLDKARRAASIELFTGLGIALLTIMGAIFGRDALWLMGALAVGNGIGMIAALGGRPHPTPQTGGIDLHWRWQMGLPFVLVGLAGALFQGLDLYLVAALYARPEYDAVAFYAASLRVVSLLLIVPTAWGTVMLPRYIRAYQTSPLAARRLWRRQQGALLMVGIALAAVSGWLSTPFIGWLLGESYTIAAPILAILGCMVIPVCVSAPTIALLTAQGRTGGIAMAVIIAGGAALLIILLIGIYIPFSPPQGVIAIAAVKVFAMALLAWLYGRAVAR
ncbi:MAG TPA: oligosaccharide flippase family protein [Aggregatilineales bacterium]|nr:oligosaccharide flippase family protein [Aggregatilineales bacterium]